MTEDMKTTPPASVAPAEKDDASLGRRGFFRWMTVGWLAFSAATGGFFTVIVRFLFPNVLFEPPQTFKAGFPNDYASNFVDTRFKKKFNVWMVRDEESIFALSTVCTHLGDRKSVV